jgi:adenylate kinase
MFRGLDRSSELGRLFHDLSSRGELVPDQLTVKLWAQEVGSLVARGDYDPGRQLLVLDGIPRSLTQCKLLDDRIEVLLVVHLCCADKQRMIERLRARALKEDRDDDAREAVIRHRWEVYEAETAPVLDHYDRSIVREIEAEGHPATVLRRILEVAAPIVESGFANVLG